MASIGVTRRRRFDSGLLLKLKDSSVGRADDFQSSCCGFESRSSAPFQPEQLILLKGTGRALQSQSGRVAPKGDRFRTFDTGRNGSAPR